MTTPSYDGVLSEHGRGNLAGRREALAAAIALILREARRGESAAPPNQRITYTGGLRRAAKLLDAELGKVMEQEREYGG